MHSTLVQRGKRVAFAESYSSAPRIDARRFTLADGIRVGCPRRCRTAASWGFLPEERAIHGATTSQLLEVRLERFS
jgi:hypothetical protein